MTQTNNLKFDLVAQSQSQKEVTINEGLSRLDAISNRGVIDKDLSTPPGSPMEGDTYIVKATATGAWLGKEGQIAYYNQGWKFIVPNEGLTLWVNDEDKLYIYNGTSWVSYGDNLQNLQKLGINTSADTTNRLAVSSDAVLLTTSSGDLQVKVNKNSASNTSSLLLQNGYSSRAEVGLIGDDDFRVKVSPNGTGWYNSLIVNRFDGTVNLSNGYTAGSGTTVKRVLSTTASFDYPSIAAYSSADLTVSVIGVTASSSATVQLGLPNAPTAGIMYMGFVSATDAVTIRAFNTTSAAINPAAQTIRIAVMNF